MCMKHILGAKHARAALSLSLSLSPSLSLSNPHERRWHLKKKKGLHFVGAGLSTIARALAHTYKPKKDTYIYKYI